MNLTNVKNINQDHVYQLLYHRQIASKAEIAETLGISLPTVSRCVNDLAECRLVSANHYFESSGGRKAVAVSFRSRAKIALGATITKQSVSFCAIDLLGNTLASKTIDLPFSMKESYCKRIARELEALYPPLNIATEDVLGAGIGIQGSIDPSTGCVTFGALLGADGFSPQSIAQHLPYPCVLLHDSEASALYAFRREHTTADTLYIMLDTNIGGAIRINGALHRGKHLPSGLIEHMRIAPGGRRCYCGKYGCLETYCSVSTLESDARCTLSLYFQRMRKGDSFCRELWRQFLEHLAVAIYNYQIVLNTEVLLGGSIAGYMTEDDLKELSRLVIANSRMTTSLPPIRLTRHGNIAAGAAMHYVEEFLAKFGITTNPQQPFGD